MTDKRKRSNGKPKASRSKDDKSKTEEPTVDQEPEPETASETEPEPDPTIGDSENEDETPDAPFVPEGLWDRPGVAECIDKLWDRPNEVRLRQEIADWIGRHEDPLVDVGCGSARIAKPLGTDYYIGVDPSKAMLDLAPPSVETRWASADSLPFETFSVPTVLCANVFRHLTNYVPVLNEIARIANGRVFLVDAFRHGETETGTAEVCGEEFTDTIWSFEELLADLGHAFPGWTIEKRTFTTPQVVGLKLEAPKK